MSNKDFVKFKVVRNEIYPLSYSFCLVRKESADKYLKGNARCVKDGSHIFIYIEASNRADRASVAHELFHAVEFTMDHIGQPFSSCPNETWAYLIQWLTDEWYKFLNQ